MCDSSSHHTDSESSTALFTTIATTILLIGSLLVITVSGGPAASTSAPRPTVEPGVHPLTALSASFSTNVSSGAAPLAVGFTITASGGSTPYTFHWYFGDGASCTTCISTSAKHTYSAAGTYTVKLYVIDSAGTNASGGSTTITATTSLSASFTTNVTSGPAPLAVGFTITASGGSTPYTFHWYFGDGASCTTCISTSAKHTYSAAGTYTVKLYVIDSAGTNASGGSTTIIVSSSGVTASFTTNVTAGPAPLAVGFTISVSTTRTYWFHWYFGDGSSCTRCTSTSASHTYGSPGIFTVRLYAIDQGTGLNVTGGNTLINVTNKYVPLTCIGANLGTVWASLSGSLPASKGGFTGRATATINGSLTSTFKLCLAASGGSFTRLSTSVTLFTNASLNFTASGGYQYSTGSSPITLGKPYSGPWIYVPGTFLVFVPIVTPVLILDATMAGSLTLGADENSSTTLGMNWSSASGWSSIYHAPSCLNGASTRTLCFKPNQPSWGASASIRAELGLEVSLALYGIAGPELTFGPYVQFSAAAGSSSTLQPTACGAMTMGSTDPDWFGLCGGFAVSAGASVGLFGYKASTYTAAERNLTTTLLAASVAISPTSSAGSPVKVVHSSTLTLSVTVAGDSSFGSYGTVKWAVKGTGCGTISTSVSGASATYSASSTIGVTCKIVATLAGSSVVLQSIGLDQAAGWIKQT
jgi:PKD repeat protein